ncbi:MAG: hypothetical protein AAFN42_21920 [Cyanobacteria bacterium J06554_1]
MGVVANLVRVFMTWFLAYVVFVGLILVLGHGLLARAIGQAAARRNMSYVMPWMVVGFAIAFTAFLITPLRQTGWSFFYLTYVIGSGLWLLSWPWRKRRAGSLLLNAGRTWHHRVLFSVGVLEVVIAAIITWITWVAMTDFVDISSTVVQLSLKITFWWMVALFILSLGLNKLELREDGLCFLYTVIPWRRMKSYTWEATHPNTLTIRIEPPRFLCLPNSMSIRVPEAHRGAIDQIIQTHIPIGTADSLALS